MNEIHTLAAQVAAELGWQVEQTDEPMTHGAGIVGPDGERLWLRVSNWPASDRGKVLVSGTLPGSYSEGDHRGLDRHEIRVSMSRGATVVAREIERRFLPGYRASLAIVRARVTAREARADQAGRVGRELASLMGGAYDESRKTIWTASGSAPYGTFSVSDDSVRIDLSSVPVSVAREIARILGSEVAAR